MTTLASRLVPASILRQGDGGRSGPPPRPAGWQEFARVLVERGQQNLWSTQGIKALAFLRKQGLTEDTIRTARLGYWPADERFGCVYDDAALWLPRGIVIPWCEGADVEGVRIRRPVKASGARDPGSPGVNDPVSVLMRGSRPGIYPGREAVRTGAPLIMVDEEFDALLLGQQLVGLASVIALGNTRRPRPRVLSAMLGAPLWVAVSFSGSITDSWFDESERFSRLEPPNESGASWVELHQAGVDLTSWWSRALERLACDISPAREAEGKPRVLSVISSALPEPRFARADVEPEEPAEPLPETTGGSAIIDWAASDVATLAVVEKLSDENDDLNAVPPEVLEEFESRRRADDEDKWIPMPAEPDDGRWRCSNPFCLKKREWWMSAFGVVNCRNCVPPALPLLVIAAGNSDDAPMVEPGRSNQAVEGPWRAHLPAALSDPSGPTVLAEPDTEGFVSSSDRAPPPAPDDGGYRDADLEPT